MKNIRTEIEKYNILDYQTLIHILDGYKQPRDKLTNLLRSGELIRIKKGLYISGDNYRKNKYSREVLANLIFGPSYISLEYALAYYQMIPEQVNVVTSITSQRNKIFNTPLGTYTYKHLPLNCYTFGISRMNSVVGHYLIACREKALLDKIFLTAGIVSLNDLRQLLFEDLRIDKSDLLQLDLNIMRELAAEMSKKSIQIFLKLIEESR